MDEKNLIYHMADTAYHVRRVHMDGDSLSELIKREVALRTQESISFDPTANQ